MKKKVQQVIDLVCAFTLGINAIIVLPFLFVFSIFIPKKDFEKTITKFSRICRALIIPLNLCLGVTCIAFCKDNLINLIGISALIADAFSTLAYFYLWRKGDYVECKYRRVAVYVGGIVAIYFMIMALGRTFPMEFGVMSKLIHGYSAFDIVLSFIFGMASLIIYLFNLNADDTSQKEITEQEE